MPSHRAEAAPRRWPLAPLVVLAVVAGLASVTGVGTYALWNDRGRIEASSLTSGRLDLRLDPGTGAVDDVTAWSGLQLTDIAPGESKAAVVTVRNDGDVPFALSATASAAGAELAPAVTLRVVAEAAASVDTTYPRQERCGAGTVVFSGTLTTSTTTLPAAGVLPARTAVGLCFEATLSADAGNTLQGRSWTPTFVLTATQS